MVANGLGKGLKMFQTPVHGIAFCVSHTYG